MKSSKTDSATEAAALVTLALLLTGPAAPARSHSCKINANLQGDVLIFPQRLNRLGSVRYVFSCRTVMVSKCSQKSVNAPSSKKTGLKDLSASYPGSAILLFSSIVRNVSLISHKIAPLLLLVLALAVVVLVILDEDAYAV